MTFEDWAAEVDRILFTEYPHGLDRCGYSEADLRQQFEDSPDPRCAVVEIACAMADAQSLDRGY